MSKDNKQTIRCNVSSCKYNDCDCNMCNLNEIDVSCSCNKNKCSSKKETICNSFKEKE